MGEVELSPKDTWEDIGLKSERRDLPLSNVMWCDAPVSMIHEFRASIEKVRAVIDTKCEVMR